MTNEPEAGDDVFDENVEAPIGKVRQMITRARNGPGDTGEFTWWVTVDLVGGGGVNCNVRLFTRPRGLQFERI